MNWITIKARYDQAPADWSPVVDIFREFGIENTLEDKETLVGCYVDVDGVQTQIEALRNALSGTGISEFIAEPFVEKNWEEEWKKFFKPRRIGKNFVVRPTWEEFAAQPNDHVIVLDPGQAFGTGDHPTTRMCLAFLEKYVTPGLRVLDLGCGSGILAIGAKMVGASDVMAIDIDPIAVEVARENSSRNSVSIECAAGDVLALNLAEGWDVVVSNIISATLINLAPDAAFALAKGGIWIVSGIIVQNWEDVQRAAVKSGLGYVEHREEDGWVSAVFRK
jgi:ribosomal protein L11 methyltransferase